MDALRIDAADAFGADAGNGPADADLLGQLRTWTAAISAVRSLAIPLPPVDPAHYWDEAAAD